MAKTITTRLPDEFVLKIKKIAKRENLDTSAIIRRLLASALKQEMKNTILDRLMQHQISIGKAAQELNMSIYEIINLAEEKKIDWTGYNKVDFENELVKIGKNDI